VVALPSISADELRQSLEEKGFRVRVELEGEVCHLRADRYGVIELATLLTHLAILLLIVGYGLTGWLGQWTRLEVGPNREAALGVGTGLTLRNDGFAIDHYPDGSAAGYHAAATVFEAGREVASGTIEVNRPLRLHGVSVYLTGFREVAEGVSLQLQVARDPGAAVALVGAMFLMVGVTASLYFPHRRLYAQLESEQALLSVRSSVWRGDGAAELAGLVQELGE
jgi:cytochrome c biogenesis protein ResB